MLNKLHEALWQMVNEELQKPPEERDTPFIDSILYINSPQCKERMSKVLESADIFNSEKTAFYN